MTDPIKKDMKTKLSNAVQSLKIALAKIRTGRAHPSILDTVLVTYMDSTHPIKQMASITVEDSRTLKLTLYDIKSINAVSKAILNANLGLNPSNTGTAIYVPLPALTEETRKFYIKQLRSDVENARIIARNARRDAFTKYKTLLKNKEISENDEKRLSNIIQKEMDATMSIMDDLLSQKEKEIMTI